MALELSDFTKTVLSAEAELDANRNVAIAYVLIDLLSGKLSSDQKGEHEVKLAQEIYPTDPENPLTSLDEQIGFVEEIENTIKGVEGLGTEAIDAAKNVLIRLIEETKLAVKESDLFRAQHSEVKDRSNIVRILESRLGDDAKIGFLKALGIKVNQVVLNIQEVTPKFPNPTNLLAEVVNTISGLANTKKAQTQVTKPAERTKEDSQGAVDEVFKRFYATNKRIIPREELKGGLYPLDISLYEILRKIVNSKDKRITKDALRKHLGTNYTVQMSRIMSTLRSTELIVEEISGYWVARLREDYNPSSTIQTIGGKRIVDRKKITPKERKTKIGTMVTEDLVLKVLGDKERTNKEIVDSILASLAGKSKHTRETIEIVVYKELGKLEKDGTIQKTGRGVRGSPYKYKLIKKTEPVQDTSNEQPVIGTQAPVPAGDLVTQVIEEEVINIQQGFEKAGYTPPTIADMGNPVLFNVHAERFFEMFETRDDALSAILEWIDLDGSAPYAKFFEKLFSYNSDARSIHLLPVAIIRVDKDRAFDSDEVLNILNFPFTDKPHTISTSSAFIAKSKVDVKTYRLTEYPKLEIGFALSQNGSKVFEALVGKTVEINRVLGKLIDLFEKVSNAQKLSDVKSDYFSDPINPGLKVLKVSANNAIRIYYTLEPVINNGENLPETRQIIIWGITDKHGQKAVLDELSKRSSKSVKDSLSETRRR